MRHVQTQTFSLPPEIPYVSTGVCRGLVSHLTIGGVGSRADVFTYASACICGRVHVVHVYERINNASVCVHRRVHGNVLVCTSLLRCLCHLLLRSSANGGQREGRGEELAVTPVPRTSSGLIRRIWQLKLDVCTLSASSNS